MSFVAKSCKVAQATFAFLVFVEVEPLEIQMGVRQLFFLVLNV